MKPAMVSLRGNEARGTRTPGNPRNSRHAWALLLSLLAVGCLKDHPVVGGANVANLEEYFSRPDFPPGMTAVEVHLADDSLRPSRLHWSGPVKDLDGMPRYLKGDDERIRLHLQGFRPSGTHCYTAKVDGPWSDRRELLNTCPDTPSVAIVLNDSGLAPGDSLAWFARAQVKFGTLSKWTLETGWGVIVGDTLTEGDDSIFVSGVIPVQGSGAFQVTFTVWTGTGIEGRTVGVIGIIPRKETLPPPKIQSLTVSDTAVSVKDSLVYKATIRAFGSSLRHRWGGQEGILPIPVPGDPMVIEYRTAFSDSGWKSLKLELAGAAPPETVSSWTPQVHVLLDPPVVTVSADTTVMAGTQFILRGSATQRFGTFESFDWLTPRGSLKEPGQTTFTVRAPDSPGVYSYTFRATDDDGNIASATQRVAVVADSGAYLVSFGVSSFPLTPVFQSGHLTYTTGEVPYESTLVFVNARAKSAASTLLAAGTSHTGNGTWPMVLKTGANPFPILVTDTLGRKVNYTLTVIRKPVPSEPVRMAYSFAYLDPMGGRPPAIWDSYSSNGRGPSFVNDKIGGYHLVFSGIYKGGTGQPSVQVTAQGEKPARCVVGWFRGMDSDLDLYVTCYGADGQPFNSGFTVMLLFPRSAATGPNAIAHVDTLPGTAPRTLVAAYNSAGKPVTIQSMERGVYSTVFEGFPIGTAPTPMVTRLGSADGWCGVDTAKAAGSGTQVIVRCYDRNGTPEDANFSLALTGPLGEGLAFDLGYVPCPEQGTGPSYNSKASGVFCQGPFPGPGSIRTYGVFFSGIGYLGRSEGGNIQVSARAKDGRATCQVVDWQGDPSATAKVACFDRAGIAISSGFNIWYTKAK